MTATDETVPDRGEEYIEGDTARLVVTVTDDAGDAVNLTGATAAFALARTRGGDPLVTKSTDGGGITLTDPANGELTITIDGADTADLGSPRGRRHYYEVTIRDGSGQTVTVTTGTWTIHEDTVPADW
jgi:hypothetical protein